jgi:hypothetical protein
LKKAEEALQTDNGELARAALTRMKEHDRRHGLVQRAARSHFATHPCLPGGLGNLDVGRVLYSPENEEEVTQTEPTQLVRSLKITVTALPQQPYHDRLLYVETVFGLI